MVTEEKREEKKHSYAKELYKSGKKRTQSLRTDSLVEQYHSKVPERSASNRKQSYSVLN